MVRLFTAAGANTVASREKRHNRKTTRELVISPMMGIFASYGIGVADKYLQS